MSTRKQQYGYEMLSWERERERNKERKKIIIIIIIN